MKQNKLFVAEFRHRTTCGELCQKFVEVSAASMKAAKHVAKLLVRPDSEYQWLISVKAHSLAQPNTMSDQIQDQPCQ